MPAKLLPRGAGWRPWLARHLPRIAGSRMGGIYGRGPPTAALARLRRDARTARARTADRQARADVGAALIGLDLDRARCERDALAHAGESVPLRAPLRIEAPAVVGDVHHELAVGRAESHPDLTGVRVLDDVRYCLLDDSVGGHLERLVEALLSRRERDLALELEAGALRLAL